MSRNIVFRILAALVLLAAIAGIAGFAFNAGLARGAVVNLQAPAAGQPPVPYYGMPYMHPFPFFGFGFGFFGLLFPIFLLFLAFGAARRMIWGPRWGWRHMHHADWGDRTAGGDFVPPMFTEWHRRAHGEPEKPVDSATQK